MVWKFLRFNDDDKSSDIIAAQLTNLLWHSCIKHRYTFDPIPFASDKSNLLFLFWKQEILQVIHISSRTVQPWSKG